MFKPETVIVLGAAVSNEVDFPLGDSLKTDIANVLPTDSGGGAEAVRSALYGSADREDLDRYGKAVRAVLTALPKAASIDNLIEHRGSDEAFKVTAKVGILAALLQRERHSRLFRSTDTAQGTIDCRGSTYANLFRLVIGNAPVGHLSEALGRVRFVNFNYDRSLEHYLIDWLMAYSGLPYTSSAKLVRENLKVVRPYGSLGDLPELLEVGTATGVKFGHSLDELDLRTAASRILTFSEERHAGIEEQVQSLVRNAKQLIFLGCAYHPQNMRLLTPNWTSVREVYGTCYVVPPEDKLSRPSMDSFAIPTIETFNALINGWPAPVNQIIHRQIKFEALTARQLVAKYAPRWTEH